MNNISMTQISSKETNFLLSACLLLNFCQIQWQELLKILVKICNDKNDMDLICKIVLTEILSTFMEVISSSM